MQVSCAHALKAREAFRSLDEAGLRAPVPLSHGRIGMEDRFSAFFSEKWTR